MAKGAGQGKSREYPMQVPNPIRGADWASESTSTVKGKPENKQFSLKVPGGAQTKDRYCSTPNRVYDGRGRRLGQTTIFNERQKQAYFSEHARYTRSHDYRPFFEKGGLFFFNSDDKCAQYVVRSPDFRPDYDLWWSDYPNNLFEVVTPPFWRNWLPEWPYPPDSVNPYINGKPEESTDEIPLIQLPGDENSSGSNGVDGAGGEVTITASSAESGTLLSAPGTGNVTTLTIEINAGLNPEDISWTLTTLGQAYVDGRTFGTYTVPGQTYFENIDIIDGQSYYLFVQNEQEDGLSSPGYIILKYGSDQIFDSDDILSPIWFTYQTRINVIKPKPAYVEAETDVTFKIEFEPSDSSWENVWNVTLRSYSGTPYHILPNTLFQVYSPTTYEYKIPFDDLVLMEFKPPGFDALGRNKLKLYLNNELFFDTAVDTFARDELNPYYYYIPIGYGRRSFGGKVVYSYNFESRFYDLLQDPRVLSFSKLVETDFDVYVSLLDGQWTDWDDAVASIPGKNNEPGNHIVGARVPQQVRGYTGDTDPFEWNGRPNYGQDSLYHFKVIDEEGNIEFSQIDIRLPVTWVGGELEADVGPGPQQWICTCPDWSRHTAYNRVLSLPSERLRDWKQSGAGARGDCKHIMAAKRYLGLELPVYSDAPASY